MGDDGALGGDTVDIMATSITALLAPAVQRIDDALAATTASQTDLQGQIAALQTELVRFEEAQQFPVELDEYVRKLGKSRQKVVAMSSLLNVIKERTNRLQASIAKATKRLEQQSGQRTPSQPATPKTVRKEDPGEEPAEEKVEENAESTAAAGKDDDDDDDDTTTADDADDAAAAE